MKETIRDRLDQAGLNTERFIQCQDGQKSSVDHTRRHYDEVSGEYGIYAMASDGLVILDIDDYDEIDDRSGLSALSELEPTLEQNSPHGGTHRLYAIQPAEDGRMVSDVFEDIFGVKNPNPSWGEVRAANQYVVGAGSQLDGCEKDWCDECTDPDGGRYELAADRRIAVHTVEEIVEVLTADPDITTESDEEDSENEEQTDGATTPSVDADDADILEFARQADEKLDRLWGGDYSDYNNDRSRAESALAMKLGWWFQGDKQTVRRLMDQANAEKWAEREDDSYRDSVLEAVDLLDDYYDPTEYSVSDPAEIDPEEVARGMSILRAQTTPESPAGSLKHTNGCYGYEKVYTNEEGEVTDTVFDTVVNFTIETLSYLTMDDGQQQMKLRIHPQHAMEESYDVRVTPSVFNSAQTFKEEIVRGRTTAFEPSNRDGVPVASVLADLRRTAGSQAAPQRTGSEFIGLSEDHSEWVTPEGSITADGWADDPDYEFFVKTGESDQSGAIAQKWQLSPDERTGYDESEVRQIVELLPNIRQTERGLPILGWYYAAPLKPLITEWTGEFNLLQVTGETGSGKTATLQTYWQLFGSDENPFSASDTGFTIEKHMAESCGLPVWIDEYKPTDIADHRLKRLRRRLREVTRERTISKGTQSLDEVTFTIRAPVVISGEQKIKESAVRRRAIMTNLTQAATDPGSETVEAFAKLTGTGYTDDDGTEHYPEGCDFEAHAFAYYQWLLSQDDTTLRNMWKAAKDKKDELLSDLGVTMDEGSEGQGLQTIIFGTKLYRRFAEAHDADTSTLPTDDDLRAAFEHVISNIGKEGNRREHTDEWLELMTLAANEGYLEQGKHYKVTDSRKHEQQVLDVHLPSAFTAVKKYLREFNIEGEYTTLSKGDYDDAFNNKAEQDGTFVIDTSVKVKGISNGNRCVRFDPDRATEKMGADFDLGAFSDAATEDDEDDADATPIEALSTDGNPYATVTVTVTAWDAGPDGGPAEKGVVEDSTGLVDIVDWFGCALGLEEGGTFRLENVRVGSYNGSIQLEIVKGATTATEIQQGAGYTSLADAGDNEELQASADGGQQTSVEHAEADDQGSAGGDDTPLAARVVQLATAKAGVDDGPGVAKDDLVSWLVEEGYDEDRIEHKIEKHEEEGNLYTPQSGRVEIT